MFAVCPRCDDGRRYDVDGYEWPELIACKECGAPCLFFENEEDKFGLCTGCGMDGFDCLC